MTSWSYVEPGDDGETPVVQTLTEDEIWAEYGPYWRAKMTEVGKADLISKQRCINDWVTIHWACPESRDATPEEASDAADRVLAKYPTLMRRLGDS